jgi:hypothetical protein
VPTGCFMRGCRRYLKINFFLFFSGLVNDGNEQFDGCGEGYNWFWWIRGGQQVFNLLIQVELKCLICFVQYVCGDLRWNHRFCILQSRSLLNIGCFIKLNVISDVFCGIFLHI